MPAWTMTGTSDAAEALQAARDTIPRDLGSVDLPAEQLRAFAAQAQAVRATARQWARGAYLATASGPWIDLHARDRGERRQTGESGDDLRSRLRVPPDAATSPAILESVNQVLTSAGVSGSAELVRVPRDAGAFGSTATARSFASRGDRVWRNGRGHLVVIVPPGTSDGTAASVARNVEAKRTAGSASHVETETT